MDDTKLDTIKDAFRAFYCERGSAEHLGVIAAYQRSHLYTPGRINRDIHEKWESQLNLLAEKYKTKDQSEEVFINDILQLKHYMNHSFPERFNNGTPGYDNEFRIAHAQKSLSICLKHLWIRGELGTHIPPVCPVDGVVLKYVHNNDAWTKVNSLNERELINGVMEKGYNDHLGILKRQACQDGFKCLPEWELVVWWQDKSKREKAKTEGKQTIQRSKKRSSESAKKLDSGDVEILLKVYDGRRLDNHGKVFQIVNNNYTGHHNTNNVYLEYNGVRYRANEGTYKRGNTIRGAQTIRQLIADNHWRPGQEFRCEFTVADDNSHIYSIIEPIDN